MLVDLDTGQRQQIVDQPRHPACLFFHDPQETLLGRPVRDLVEKNCFDKSGETGQRRAQLMAHIRHEIAPDLFKIALERHIEKQDDDQPVIRSPGANIEFHRHAGLRGKDKCSLLIAALDDIKDVLAGNDIRQRLAGQTLAKDANSGAVRRHDSAGPSATRRPSSSMRPTSASMAGSFTGDRSSGAFISGSPW